MALARERRDTYRQAHYAPLERAVGFFLFIGFALVVAGAFIVGAGRNLFLDYNRYFIVYHDGYGLLPGVKVRFLGIDIGDVTEIELMDNDKIRLDLRILEEYASRIKGDSLAVVKSPTLIGSEYIEIQSGSAASLPIPPTGQIPAKDPKTVQNIIEELRLQEKLAQFETIMADVASLSNQLQDPQGPLLGTMANVQSVTRQISAGEGSFGGFVSKDEIYNEILATLQELRRVSVSLSQAAAQINADIPALTGQIDAILREVETGTRSFPEIARGTREGLRDVHQVLDSVKRNFLIRGNITPSPPPEGLTRPAREN
ncbi:MAG: MlaD family protein [Deltaproteobacteria bacterium]|jgi:phospholipid/cholesterol/gamma-HCH transport system substrate-binding protein|nr:MlaD family protein [Deltaproteobacteria bacterium]